MSPTRKQMGARIRAVRTKQSMSQAALAKKSGLTPVYVSRLEAGLQDPSLSTITALAKALGLTASALLREPKRKT